MGLRRLSTKNYPESARARLADAVAKGRAAAGFKYRTDFARATDTNIRSLNMLEAGDPGVGQTVLFAVARALPNWTEDTPREILEGGPVPPTAAEQPARSQRSAADELALIDPRDPFEREALGHPGSSPEMKLYVIQRHREILERQNRELLGMLDSGDVPSKSPET